MATVTSTRAGSTFPVSGGVGNASSLKVAYGTYRFTTAASGAAATRVEFCKLPKGAVVIGGEYTIGKIETTTSGDTFDMDIGWADNGTDASDTDGFGNFGLHAGFGAVTGYKPETTFMRLPLGGVLGTAGPKTFAAETTVIGTVVASATNENSATASVVIYYYVP
jgi:hypothetical protein